MSVRAEVLGWVGVSFSPERTHEASETYVGWVSGSSKTFIEGFSNSSSRPDPSSSTISTLLSLEEVNGRTTMTFSRPLRSSQPGYLQLTPGSEVVIGYAYHDTKDGSWASYPIHNFAGEKRVDLFTGISIVSTDPPSTTPSPSSPSSSTFTDGKLSMSWKSIGSQLEISVSASVTGWIGISFSSSKSHVQSEMYVAWVSGTQKIFLEMSSDDFNLPTPTRTQISRLVRLEEVNGQTTLVFSRPLEPSDQEHISFGNNFIAVGYGYHDTRDGNGVSFPKHSFAGETRVNFVTGASMSAKEVPYDPALVYMLLVCSIGIAYVSIRGIRGIIKHKNASDDLPASAATRLLPKKDSLAFELVDPPSSLQDPV